MGRIAEAHSSLSSTGWGRTGEKTKTFPSFMECKIAALVRLGNGNHV